MLLSALFLTTEYSMDGFLRCFLTILPWGVNSQSGLRDQNSILCQWELNLFRSFNVLVNHVAIHYSLYGAAVLIIVWLWVGFTDSMCLALTGPTALSWVFLNNHYFHDTLGVHLAFTFPFVILAWIPLTLARLDHGTLFFTFCTGFVTMTSLSLSNDSSAMVCSLYVFSTGVLSTKVLSTCFWLSNIFIIDFFTLAIRVISSAHSVNGSSSSDDEGEDE